MSWHSRTRPGVTNVAYSPIHSDERSAGDDAGRAEQSSAQWTTPQLLIAVVAAVLLSLTAQLLFGGLAPLFSGSAAQSAPPRPHSALAEHSSVHPRGISLGLADWSRPTATSGAACPACAECAACPACPAAPACPPPPVCPRPPPSPAVDLSNSPNLCGPQRDYPVSIPPRVFEYCASPYPLSPYVPPALPLEELVIGLLTVDTFQHDRDEFVLHSWGNPIRAPRVYFTCSIPRPEASLQPCVDIPQTHDLFLSNINKTMLGLRELYYKHPDAKWYFLSGDDDYVMPNYLLTKLQQLDHTQPIFAGGAGLNGKCANTGRAVEFFSGGGGMVASHALMKASAALMSDWIETSWMRGAPGNFRDGGDVAVACFFQELNATRVYLKGFHVGNPRDSWMASLHDIGHRDYHEEVNQWHYIGHSAFLYGDIYFGMQMVDRMHRNGQWALLAQYTRQLVMERYHQAKRSLTLIVGTEFINKQT